MARLDMNDPGVTIIMIGINPKPETLADSPCTSS
jgi:hypothetical protein